MRRRRNALAVAGALAVLATAGCSYGLRRSVGNDFEPHSVPAVKARFEAAMGETLHTRFTDLSRFGIPPAVAGEPTKEQRRRLGDFSIYIFDKPENVEGLPHVEPDAYGFRWSYEIPERGGDDGQWAATKVYGNVRLTWFAATRGHDERLIALDGALSGLG